MYNKMALSLLRVRQTTQRIGPFSTLITKNWPQRVYSSYSKIEDLLPPSLVQKLSDRPEVCKEVVDIIFGMHKRNNDVIFGMQRKNNHAIFGIQKKNNDVIFREREKDKTDFLDFAQKKNAELLEFTQRHAKKVAELENDEKEKIKLLLQMSGKYNIRGALEFIGAMIHFRQSLESVDTTLSMLNNNGKFTTFLKDACDDNGLRHDDVIRTLGELYHNASKDLHEHSSDIVINGSFWSNNEVMALGVLFSYYRVPYRYNGGNGNILEFPYTIESIK